MESKSTRKQKIKVCYFFRVNIHTFKSRFESVGTDRSLHYLWLLAFMNGKTFLRELDAQNQITIMKSHVS